MRRIIRKVFFVWDYDKEEKWLNEMAAKGLGLVSAGFCKYEFEDCEPGEYKIGLQLLDKMPDHPESQKYIEFVEATGAEHIGSCFRWVYFRKKANGGEFELYSDMPSRVKHLGRMIALILPLSLINLLLGIIEIKHIGCVNLVIGIVGTLGSIRLLKMRRKLKQESQLFE